MILFTGMNIVYWITSALSMILHAIIAKKCSATHNIWKHTLQTAMKEKNNLSVTCAIDVRNLLLYVEISFEILMNS